MYMRVGLLADLRKISQWEVERSEGSDLDSRRIHGGGLRWSKCQVDDGITSHKRGRC